MCGLEAQGAVEGARLPHGGDVDWGVIVGCPGEQCSKQALGAVAPTITLVHVEALDLVMPLMRVPEANYQTDNVLVGTGYEHRAVYLGFDEEVKGLAVVRRFAGLLEDVLAGQLCRAP